MHNKDIFLVFSDVYVKLLSVQLCAFPWMLEVSGVAIQIKPMGFFVLTSLGVGTVYSYLLNHS
jgi:hypothetical protein